MKFTGTSMVPMTFTSSRLTRAVILKENATCAGTFIIDTQECPCSELSRVSTLTVDPIVYRMEIVAVPVLWKDSYRSMKVDFGASTEDLGLRRHEGLRKRREATASATASATIRPSAAFPVLPSSSPTPTIRKVIENIDMSYQDTQILPPVFPGVDSLSLNAPMVYVLTLDINGLG